MNLSEIKRGDIVKVDLDPVRGSETGKVRRCLIISNNIQNKYSPVIIIAIITEWNVKKDNIPICVLLSEETKGIVKKSVVDCAQIRTVSRDRIIGEVQGKINDNDIQKVNKALRLTLSL